MSRKRTKRRHSSLDLVWFHEHLDELQEYAGEYVAIANERVIAVGTPRGVYVSAKWQGVSAPLIVHVPRREAIGDKRRVVHLPL